MFEHVKFAVIRDVVLRLQTRNEIDVVFVISVTGKVEWADLGHVALAVLDDKGAFAEQPVNGADDARFVARNRVRRENDDVARLNFDVFVGAGDHAVQDGVHFALGPGTDDNDFIVRKFHDVFHFHQGVFRDFEAVGANGDFDVVDH